MRIERALISVSDKTGLPEFGKGLAGQGIEIISTGGTARALEEAGVKVVGIDELTGFPEMLDGRVKTLHPKVHAGILADKTNEKHMEQIGEQGIKTIDLVAVNLYPFKETVAKANVSFEEAIENIDIGGPTMIRAAAKNHNNVAVVVDPADYEAVIRELKENEGHLRDETLIELARKAFEHTAHYDSVITNYLNERFLAETFPQKLSNGYEKAFDCRYGENPHQKAAFYLEPLVKEPCIANAELLNGKALSFNNINDTNAAIELLKEYKETACIIVKHTNPCGAAVAGTIEKAFDRALECDSVSAFGGIIALNRKCDLATAKKITSFFNEVVVAPGYEKDALEELKKKEKLRVLEIKGLGEKKPEAGQGVDLKKVVGGMLAQDRDLRELEEDELKVVSKRKPTEEEMKALMFGWKVAKHVKSNAIVLAKGTQTVGIGAGQMSRVDAAELAVKKSGGKSKGAVLASDAFFPFRDGVDAAAKAGVTAVIEPGGSVKDEEVIEAADEHGIALVFTGVRHFKH